MTAMSKEWGQGGCGRSRPIVAMATSASVQALRFVLPCEVGTLHS